jgi:phage tail sheath gpL-like
MANTFPVTRVPYMSVMFDNSLAQTSTPTWKTLIIGHSLPNTKAGINTPYLISSSDQGMELFGLGSCLSEQIKSYKDNDSNIETWAIAISEGDGSTPATSIITPTIAMDDDGKTPASVSGTVSLYIAGSLVQIGIQSTNKVTDIGLAINSAINKNQALSCTSSYSSDTGVVTLTAKHKGAFLNGLDVSFNLNGETFPVGLSFTAGDFDGGAGVPDVESVFTAIKDTRFNTFVFPFSDLGNLKKLSDILQSRWEPTTQNDGFCFTTISKSIADSISFGANLNSQNISILNTYGVPNPGYCVGSAAAAQCSASALADPARPLSTLVLSGIIPPPQFAQFSFKERGDLLNGGISTLNYIGNNVCLERVITTYKKNNAGIADESYLNTEKIFTLSFIREYFRTKFWGKFNCYKLADDGTEIMPGQKIITPKKAKAELICVYQELAELGLVEKSDVFMKNLVVARDKKNNYKLNFLLPPKIISQLFNVDATLQFM